MCMRRSPLHTRHTAESNSCAQASHTSIAFSSLFSVIVAVPDMLSNEEEEATLLNDKIQAAVQAEVEGALARLIPPALGAVSSTPPVSAPPSSAVPHPGKQLCLLFVSFLSLVLA